MSISKRNRLRTTWLLAALVAVGMNLLLFGAMPYLARAVPAAPDYGTLVSQIQVIRLKRPETPPERKAPEPPKPRETVTPDQTPRPARPLATRLSLPFEVAPRLPAGPGTLALPAFDLSALNLGPPGVFEAGDLDRQLVVVSRMPPVYPLNARRNGIQGWVNVRFIVNEQGRVEDVTIREADPREVFDQSVIRCVSGWRFQPGTVDGRPVKVWAETTLHFELE
ncbi:MAG: energy transducer TonB [Desulfatitalea sp.]|nr:energy transducer TonB [Desulfatitalea sp.]